MNIDVTNFSSKTVIIIDNRMIINKLFVICDNSAYKKEFPWSMKHENILVDLLSLNHYSSINIPYFLLVEMKLFIKIFGTTCDFFQLINSLIDLHSATTETFKLLLWNFHILTTACCWSFVCYFISENFKI